ACCEPAQSMPTAVLRRSSRFMRVVIISMAVRTAVAVAVLVSFGIAGSVQRALAAVTTIDFESPTYTTGDLIGQEGWAPNSYYTPPMNGTVTVSNASPLSGAQSLSYTQTVAGGLSDIHT